MNTECSAPLTLYTLVGSTNKNGKAIILTRPPPDGVKFKMQYARCGQCIGCRVHRKNSLSLRLKHESEFHDQSWFCTLTYNPESEPYAGSLVSDHVPKFIRALRQKTKQKIRYFGIGEYGSTCQGHVQKNCPQCGPVQRPHHHLILYGLSLSENRPGDLQYRQSKNLSTMSRAYSSAFLKQFGEVRAKYFSSPLLESVWKKGFVNLTGVSPATMQYVSKYHVEKVTGDKSHDYYTRVLPDGRMVELEHPRSHFSTKPGIGFRWIEKYWPEIYPEGTYVTKNGAELAPPKFYDRFMENHHPEVWAETVKRREARLTIEDKILLRKEARLINQKAQFEGRGYIGRGKYRDR